MMAEKTKKPKQEIEEELKRQDEEALKLLHEPHPSQIAADQAVRYVATCVTPCVFRGRYWERGEEYRGFVAPPAHFEISEQDCVTSEKDKKTG